MQGITTEDGTGVTSFVSDIYIRYHHWQKDIDTLHSALCMSHVQDTTTNGEATTQLFVFHKHRLLPQKEKQALSNLYNPYRTLPLIGATFCMNIVSTRTPFAQQQKTTTKKSKSPQNLDLPNIQAEDLCAEYPKYTSIMNEPLGKPCLYVFYKQWASYLSHTIICSCSYFVLWWFFLRWVPSILPKNHWDSDENTEQDISSDNRRIIDKYTGLQCHHNWGQDRQQSEEWQL